jgi:hypothetical protein
MGSDPICQREKAHYLRKLHLRYYNTALNTFKTAAKFQGPVEAGIKTVEWNRME